MIFIFLVSFLHIYSCPLILRLIFVFLVSLERVKAVVTASASAVCTQLMEAGQAFFCALYGQQEGTMISQARYRLYTRKCSKLLKLMSLPPTEQNLLLHILRAQLQTILAKSADQQAPPELDITKYGWGVPRIFRGGGGRDLPNKRATELKPRTCAHQGSMFRPY